MSRIAIFGDVHGNLPALLTVLNDIENRAVDQVYCLGDLVDFAPWTNEVIDLIRLHRIPCLMGNHDERIAFDLEVVPLQKHGPEETAARFATINYTRQTITKENKIYLANLPRQITISFLINDVPVNIVMVHASTRSNDEYIYAQHNMADLQQMMQQANADLLIMGHTHLSYIRPVGSAQGGFTKQAINAGSVGRSKEGEPLAAYVLLNVHTNGIDAEIIKLPYPVAETISAIRKSEIPDFYADFFLSNR